MPTQKIDPKVIFASDAPIIDKPPVFSDKTKGWDVARLNDGRPTIKEMNKVQQDTDLKILWLNENSVTPYDESIDYPDGAVAIKDGSFKQLASGDWVEFLDGFANKDEVKRGIANRYDPLLTYNSGERVILTNGDIVKSTIDGNVNNPNTDMTGWAYDSDITAKSVSELRTKSGVTGQIARTISYYEGIDGGGATYKWVGGTEDNGFNKISGWELIFTGEIDVRCGGAIVNPSVVAAQTTEINLVSEQVSLMGGGVVNFPAGVFYASVRSQPNVQVRGRVNIDMTPATKIQAWAAVTGNENTNLLVNKPNFKAKNLELDGTVNGLPGGITGIRTTVRDCEFENIVSHSHRYDGLVVAMGSGNLKFTKCVFRHTKRNILSIGGGNNIKFIDCDFLEDATISGDSQYLIDIEPNDANGIWYDVSFTNCKISRATETANGAVFFEQKEVNPNRILNLTFNNCQFLGYAYLSPRGLYPIRGLNVINCDFEGTAFSIAGATLHYVESGLIYGNKFKNTSRFNYGVNFYGDVVFENNTFYSNNGLDSRGATFKVNTFVGIPEIKPVDRRSGGIARIIGDTANGFKLTALRKVNLSNTATFSLTLPNQCSGVLRIRSASSETLNNGTANQDVHFIIKNAQYYYNTVDNMGAAVTSDVVVTTNNLVVTLARAVASSGTYDLSLELYSGSELAVDNCLNSFNA